MSKMNAIRKEWQEVGFQTVNYKVHYNDRQLIDGFLLMTQAERLLEIINDKYDSETSLEVSFMLSRRYDVKNAVGIAEVLLWEQENPGIVRRSKADLARVKDALARKQAAYRNAENAKAYMEVKGVTAEKYEEATREAAKSYAYGLLAHGAFKLLQLGMHVEARRNV